jgi:hypothetical protein
VHRARQKPADLQPGSPISRDLALRLIHCSDNDLPALLAAASSYKCRHSHLDVMDVTENVPSLG